MSQQYDLYLKKHKANVKKGFDWLQTNMPWLFEGRPSAAWQTEFEHDASKSNPDEYEAYDAYFYGGNRSHAIVEAFNRAWLLHIHRNPHHWQHWVLINDDPGEGEVLLKMPYNYIIEMICDWWAFSWEKGDLSEIFSWYDDHQAYIKLHPKPERQWKIFSGSSGAGLGSMSWLTTASRAKSGVCAMGHRILLTD